MYVSLCCAPRFSASARTPSFSCLPSTTSSPTVGRCRSFQASSPSCTRPCARDCPHRFRLFPASFPITFSGSESGCDGGRLLRPKKSPHDCHLPLILRCQSCPALLKFGEDTVVVMTRFCRSLSLLLIFCFRGQIIYNPGCVSRIHI